MQTVQDIVRKTTEYFRSKAIETARLDAELLIADALGWDRLMVFTRFDYPLSEDQLEGCRARVKRRASGEPVAYIVGYKDFYLSQFEVTPDTLVPRPDSELVVDRALDCVRSLHRDRLRIADFGCGTGCLGLSLALAVYGAGQEDVSIGLDLIDFSQGALEVARRNAERLIRSDHSIPVRVLEMNLDVDEPQFEPIYEIIVANPPYIAVDDPNLQQSVRLFEPPLALFSDEAGLGSQRRWMKHAKRALVPGGFAVFEVGINQAEQLALEAKQAGWNNVRISKDLAGIERVLEMQKEE